MKKQFKFWSDKEINFLKQNNGKMRAKQIAEKLGRTIQDIYSKKYAMKITKKIIQPKTNNSIPIIVNGCKFTFEGTATNIHIGANSISVNF